MAPPLPSLLLFLHAWKSRHPSLDVVTDLELPTLGSVSPNQPVWLMNYSTQVLYYSNRKHTETELGYPHVTVVDSEADRWAALHKHPGATWPRVFTNASEDLS